MYPSEVSLIPVSVSLARFVAEHGTSAFSLWYDVWFAGMPFSYAAEPVVPSLMAALYRLTNISLFDISIYFVLISHIVSIIGWGILVRVLSGDRKASFLVMFVLSILPWRLFSALTMAEVSVVFASALIPFVVLVYSYIVLTDNAIEYAVLAVILTVLLLLSNTGSIPIVMVGVVACLAISWRLKGEIIRYAKILGIVLVVSLFCVTLWYTPGYWITLFENPSIGGNSIVTVITQLFALTRASLPLIAALIVVYAARSLRSSFSIFMIVWFGTFLFITLYRFFADYDFWMDWTRWFGEVEIGVSLLVAHGYTYHYDTYRYIKLSFISFVLLGFVTLVAYRGLGSPQIISKSSPENIINEMELLAMKNDSRIFLSGTDTFWINAFNEKPQLRGGNERVSVHPYWADASFQLREGNDPELAKLWTDIFAVTTVVVHTPSSDNYYHDFKNINKWDLIGTSREETNGFRVYQFPKHSLGWVVDNGIFSVSPPEKGDDKKALLEYVSYRKDPLVIKRINSSTYSFNGEGLVNISISYHPGWKAVDEHGNELSIKRDPFGFMLLSVADSSTVTLQFNK